MYAPSGAAAKVLTNPEKKVNHDVWKACMCGFATEKILIAVALCSASICAWRRAWSQDEAGCVHCAAGVAAHHPTGRAPLAHAAIEDCSILEGSRVVHGKLLALLRVGRSVPLLQDLLRDARHGLFQLVPLR